MLQGVSSGDVDTNAGFGVPAGEVRDLDLSNPDWFNRNQLPSLDVVNQLFGRHLLGNLKPMLKGQVEVTSENVQPMSFADYSATLANPTSLHLTGVSQFDSQVLIVLSPELILNYVDFYYGGDGVHEDQDALTRDFTVTEKLVADRLHKTAAEFMTLAWESITTLEFEEVTTETNPEFSNFFDPAEVMVVSRFNVNLSEKLLGWLDLVIPRSALDPFRRALETCSQGDQAQKQKRWARSFEAQLRSTEIELSSVLTTTQVNLGELVKLKIGDILALELPPTVELTAGAVPLFKGTFGVSNGHNAIRIVERLG